ncbi:POK18 protein, partial [Indicator maculatus]|nr:POK18 protein [Indicator maculatus]
VELTAVVTAFEQWSEPINIITDSAYVAGLISRLERAYLKDTSNPHLFALLYKLKWLLDHCSNPYFIQHIQSHTALPGPGAEGNVKADALPGAVVLPDKFAQAKISHDFYHQSTKTSQRSFQLMQEQAQQIIQSCSDC